MKNLSFVKKRIGPMLLAMSMVLGILGVYIYGDGLNTRAGDVSDARYQAIYDMVEEGLGRRPLPPSEVYDKYGKMNGDYYVIALERELNAPDGICTIAPLTLLGVTDELEKNGEISLSMRTKLRKAVEKYDLDESMLPDDPSFPDGGTETPVPTREPSTGSESFTDEEIEAMDKMGTATDVPTPTESVVPAGDLQYADVTPDDWYYEAVTAMSEGGLFKGYDDGLFHPNDNITYGQWAMLMSRIAIDNYSYQMKPGDHWAQEAYSRASRDSICKGLNIPYGETLDSLYNRAQALDSAYCLAHYDKRGLENRLAESYTGKAWTFDAIPDGNLVQQQYAWISEEADDTTDLGKVRLHSTGRWISSYVLNAYNLGITHGVDANGTCNPTAPITRAEVAQLLYNMGIYSEKQCNLAVGGIGS